MMTMTESEAVEIIGYLTRSKAIWKNPELLNLVGATSSPSQAYREVFMNTGSVRKAKAGRFYRMAMRDYGEVPLGTLVAVLRLPQGEEKLEELLTTSSTFLKTEQEGEKND